MGKHTSFQLLESKKHSQRPKRNKKKYQLNHQIFELTLEITQRMHLIFQSTLDKEEIAIFTPSFPVCKKVKESHSPKTT